MFRAMLYVYEVYRERSFSKAAQKLFISQPSLSAAVKKEEQRIGAPIFDRSVSPIGLTDCGREYIRCAEKIMDIRTGFENYLNDRNELRTGRLSVGASNLFASYVLPPCLSRFTRLYPLVDIQLSEANTPVLVRQLSLGSLDLVIDNEPLSEELYTRYPLFTDQVLLAVPVKYLTDRSGLPAPLTAADIRQDRHRSQDGSENYAFSEVPLSLLEDVSFLLLRPGNDTRRLADSICRHQAFSPHTVLELDQQATAYHLACYGMGAAFVSDTLIKRVPSDPRVVFFYLGPERALRTIYFYHKKGRYITRAMREFLKIAEEDLSSFSPDP